MTTPERFRNMGLSLIEVLFTVVLFLLATGTLFALFNQMAVWRNWETEQRKQQAGSLALGAKVESMLREVSFNTISVVYPSGNPSNGDLVLGAASSRDTNGQWRETDFVPDDNHRLVIYIDQTRGELLERRTLAPPPTPVVTPLTAAELTTEAGLAETKILGSNVESFLLVHPVTDNPTQIVTTPLRFRIVQQQSTGKNAQSDNDRSVERTVVFVR